MLSPSPPLLLASLFNPPILAPSRPSIATYSISASLGIPSLQHFSPYLTSAYMDCRLLIEELAVFFHTEANTNHTCHFITLRMISLSISISLSVAFVGSSLNNIVAFYYGNIHVLNVFIHWETPRLFPSVADANRAAVNTEEQGSRVQSPLINAQEGYRWTWGRFDSLLWGTATLTSIVSVQIFTYPSNK